VITSEGQYFTHLHLIPQVYNTLAFDLI